MAPQRTLLLGLLAGVSLAAALGCSAPSEIVVVIDAEPGLSIAAIDIEVANGRPGSASVLDPTSGGPWTLGLRPSAQGGTAEVTVTARLDGGGSVEQRARMAFAPSERRLLYFYLSSACVGSGCTGTETCADPGSCVDVEREPCLFTEPLPTGPELRCATPRDAGVDAATDAAFPDAELPDAELPDAELPDAGPPIHPACDPAMGVCAIAAGARHACSAFDDGLVWCWGSNDHGELGIDLLRPLGTPTGTGVGPVVALSAGAHFTCALDRFGAVSCWGLNAKGQIGAAGGSRHLPNVVPLAGPAAAVSAGEEFACALLTDGRVQCWGNNRSGQLGSPGPDESAVPITVPPLPFAVEGISAGTDHACAWGEGLAACWGAAIAAVRVDSFTSVEQVAAGRVHSCLRLGSGEVRCVGENGRGQIGPSPDSPIVATNSLHVAVGGDASCSVATDGTRVCWGFNPDNHLGLVGELSSSYGSSPPLAAMPRDARWRQLSLGTAYTCGVTRSGQLRCWGWDLAGAVGQGAEMTRPPTELITAGVTFDHVHAGDDFTCGRSGDEVFCWGVGESGQHGDDRRRVARSSITVDDAVSVTEAFRGVGTGATHACGWTAGTTIHCWGNNLHRQVLGSLGADAPTPAMAALGAIPRQLASGLGFTCARDDGGVRCWGLGTSGQLSGALTVSTTPRTVPLRATPIGLGLGRAHGCASMPGSDLVECWGANDTGQVGQTPGPGRVTDPVRVAATGAITDLAAGDGFTCGIDGGSGVTCWGDNALGQLGRGAVGPPSPLAEPASLRPMVFDGIAAGPNHACAWSGAQLHCWGDDRWGQIAGSGAPMPSPQQVANPAGAAAYESVGLGPRHGCATITDSTGGAFRTFCWGSDEDGRLGLGRTLLFREPMPLAMP